MTVLEGGDRIVPNARPDHSVYVHRFLERRGVKVVLKAKVDRVEAKRVHYSGRESVDAFTILWTAGVIPPAFVGDMPTKHHKDGRVLVDDHLRAIGNDGNPIEDVYVLGDCAASLRPDGRMQPALSQTAIAMGAYVGDTLVRRAKGGSAGPFHFKDAGYIISLGKHSSVVDLMGVPFSGRLGWLLWAAYHLITMVGFRKQLEVGLDHLIHLMFEHDSSQILNRRQVLSDEELNLSLAPPGRRAHDHSAPGAA